MIARLLRYEKVELIWGAVSAAMTPKNASIRHIKIPKKCVPANKIRGGIMFFKIRLHIDPRARVSSATNGIFAIARDGGLSGLQRGS